MKAITTLIFILFIGFLAQAQDSNTELNKIPVPVTTTSKVDTTDLEMENEENMENEVARLYKFKNSKIKKELSFSTGKGKSKIA